MSSPVPSRRLRLLFLVALLGVLAVVGTLLHELVGGVVAPAYAAVVAVLVLVGAARARLAEQRRREEQGRTCSCCTATHFDPVQVV